MKQDKNATRPSGVSRRTVVKGAAWAVPAITVASAVPAVAQSGLEDCLQYSLTGDACKWPGAGNDWSYRVGLCFSNTCPTPVDIYIDHLENNAGKLFTPCEPGSFVGTTVTVPANGSYCTGTFAFSSTASANFIEVFGRLGSETIIRQLTDKEIPAPTQECSGTSPCV